MAAIILKFFTKCSLLVLPETGSSCSFPFLTKSTVEHLEVQDQKEVDLSRCMCGYHVFI